MTFRYIFFWLTLYIYIETYHLVYANFSFCCWSFRSRGAWFLCWFCLFSVVLVVGISTTMTSGSLTIWYGLWPVTVRRSAVSSGLQTVVISPVVVTITCSTSGRPSPGRHRPAQTHYTHSHITRPRSRYGLKPLIVMFHHRFHLIVPCTCLAQFSLSNVQKGGLIQHHFNYILVWYKSYIILLQHIVLETNYFICLSNLLAKCPHNTRQQSR